MKYQVMKVTGLALALMYTGAWACPSGDYKAEGWNPGIPSTAKASYTGNVTIKGSGEICNITWVIGKQTYNGIGIYDAKAKILSVGYSESGQTWVGSAIYKTEDKKLTGKWIISGKENVPGTEKLTKNTPK